jgi:hypothetical protein
MSGSRSGSTRIMLLIAVAAVLMGTAWGSARTSGGGMRQIAYRGYRFEVPASWPVFNLAKDPRVCVRFDRHAVYLGRPGANEKCPSAGAGRTTEAVLIEPGRNAGRLRTLRDPVTHLVTAIAPGIEVTATYGTDLGRILQITASASLPAPVTVVPRPRPATAAIAAATSIGPGSSSFTGQGFDACTAPSQANMSAWMDDSPYAAIGIYLGGSERSCAQPNLTSDWVSAQASAGWHFIPLWVGPQAEYRQLSSPASQGTSNAEAAVSAAQALGFGPGTPLYYDMESYTHAEESAATVLTFLAAWTDELHALGYRSGVYSSSSAGIADMVANYTSYAMPDVIDDALWNGQANTSDPVVPSDEWADHQRIHQYSGGVDQTYGGYELNIDQDYLDVDVTGIPALAGGPVVYDPASGNLEVYGTGTDSALWQDAWKPGSGWLGWLTLNGSITGTPSAIYDPLTGHLEVYARGANGPVFQKYWNPAPGGGWSGWIGLGGSITGSPAAIYNPVTGDLDVYATGADGTLQYNAFSQSSGWSGWVSLGGSITGSPAPVYDPVTKHLEVYVRGAGGGLFQIYDSGSGWSGWIDLGGSITGSPAAVYDPASGNLEEDFWSAAGGWSGVTSLGGSITGDPSPAYDPVGNTLGVYVRGVNGPLFQINWTPGSGWSGWVDLGGSITGSPAASYDPASGNIEVYAVATDESLFEAYHTASGWHTSDLGGSLTAP